MTIPGIYSQRDPKWGSDVLGNNPGAPYTLYNYGCLVTAIANLLWWKTADPQYDPRNVNNILRDRGGFTKGGGDLIWSVADDFLASLNIVSRGYTSSKVSLNNFLRDGSNFALVWITKPGFPQHWSAAPFVNTIADSWDATIKGLDTYTFKGAHLYTFVAAPVEVAPVATKPAIAPTIEAPQPDPVESSEVPIPDPTPSQPEYVTSFVPQTETRQILRDEAFAVDVTTGAKVADIPKGEMVNIGGYFVDQEVRYARTVWATANNKYNGIDEQFFNAPTGQVSGKPSVSNTITQLGPVLDLREGFEEAVSSVSSAGHNFCSWLFSPLIRLFGKKGL